MLTVWLTVIFASFAAAYSIGSRLDFLLAIALAVFYALFSTILMINTSSVTRQMNALVAEAGLLCAGQEKRSPALEDSLLRPPLNFPMVINSINACVFVGLLFYLIQALAW